MQPGQVEHGKKKKFHSACMGPDFDAGVCEKETVRGGGGGGDHRVEHL